jgi:small GTP-binding protein
MKHVACKIVLVGSSNVGKSSLVDRIIRSKFLPDCTNTIGINFFSKTAIREQDQIPVQLNIFDTAGSERFANLSRLYYRDADFVIVVFAVNDRDSFLRCSHWLEEKQKFAPAECEAIMVGSKYDLSATVSDREALHFVKAQQIPLFYTSAKLDYNIQELFDYIVKHVKVVHKKNVQQVELNHETKRKPMWSRC